MANDLNNDASMTPERARALHRVVRAMHDGNCPKCGHLGPSDRFYNHGLRQNGVIVEEAWHECPKCHFKILASESIAALEAFRPYMAANVAEFEAWRNERLAWRPEHANGDHWDAWPFPLTSRKKYLSLLLALGIDTRKKGD